jgi:DNA polymerase
MIAHNCTQGLARDIFSWMMRDAYNAGYQIVMHTHDEIVVRCPRETAEETKKTLEQFMSVAPPWIPDIPLGAEAKIMECYKK